MGAVAMPPLPTTKELTMNEKLEKIKTFLEELIEIDEDVLNLVGKGIGSYDSNSLEDQVNEFLEALDKLIDETEVVKVIKTRSIPGGYPATYYTQCDRTGKLQPADIHFSMSRGEGATEQEALADLIANKMPGQAYYFGDDFSVEIG